MKRVKHLESLAMSSSRVSLVHVLIFIFLLYFLLISLEIPLVFKSRSQQPMQMDLLSFSNHERHLIENNVFSQPPSLESFKPMEILSSLVYNETSFGIDSSSLRAAANEAWLGGAKLWRELIASHSHSIPRNSSYSPSCPPSISVTESEFRSNNRVVEIPCGMTIGSSVTIIGNPRWPHYEKQPMISALKAGEEAVMISQFFLELQGIKTVEGEDPPRIFHFNPRLKGDWSRKPAIELNTCYRMQWGHPFRCEGWRSSADEETVDGQVKCEKWVREDAKEDDFNTMWWLKRLIRRKKKATYTWPFPFIEGKLFVLSVRAELEGFHVFVDGRHIASFPYRTGYSIEDATGVTLNGDVDVHSVFATNLPTTHPSFSPQLHLRFRREYQAPPYSGEDPELFIGIISSGNHFAERMAVRITWMKHELIKSSIVVARFFVALTSRKEINAEIKKEAEFFGDTVIVPYVDHYDLVVFKTLAICEYSVRHASAKYVMKCDDDTFVRVDAVLNEARRFSDGKSFYMGNLNYNHTPLRSGKWGVTYEEWRKEEYPPYADGAGYVVSRDIAEHVAGRRVGVFKMEDVSVGMWVEERNASRRVEYSHSAKFCQFGCVDGYYTAHYQSPRQMLCLSDNVRRGRPLCCDGR